MRLPLLPIDRQTYLLLTDNSILKETQQYSERSIRQKKRERNFFDALQNYLGMVAAARIQPQRKTGFDPR